MHKNAKAILEYWFGDLEHTPEYFAKRFPFWFNGGKRVDAEIRRRFGKDLRRAVAGEYRNWEKTPKESLALIILLDQFSLNLHREKPASYDQSRLAIPVADRLIRSKTHRLLTPIERAFVYLPYEHSEKLSDQLRSVRLYTELAREAPGYAKGAFANTLDYAKRHYTVVRDFGRFPDRNEVYGRISTAREERFLKSKRAPF